MAVDLGLMVGFVDADGNHVAVPAPSTDPGAMWLVDWVRAHAEDIGRTFDAVQWPPTSKAQGGAGAGCDGYGVFDRYDLGTKPQQGSTPTRYGPLEGLMAAVAALSAYGVASFGDLPLHQVIGENGGPGVFDFLGADMKTLNGRGAIRPSMLRGGLTGDDPIPPFCREDDVPQPDYAFGREFSYQHCKPPGIAREMAIDWISWLTQRVGFSGFRLDDAKGIYSHQLGLVMRWTQLNLTPHTNTLPVFHAEYFDGAPEINAWATSPFVSTDVVGGVGVEDFPLHFAIQRACNGYDATQLDSAGYWQWRPELAVGFVENRDTDLGAGMAVVSNKLLGYAYGLMLPVRRFRVYAKDLLGADLWPGAYGLGAPLENLIWISRMFAFGKHQVRWVDRDVHVSTRDGDGGAIGWSGGLLTALNFNPHQARTITCATCWGPHRQLAEYTGKGEGAWTDGGGNVTITLPPGTALCFAPGGKDFVDRAITPQPKSVTQTFFGASDLDVMPVRNGMQTLPQRLWMAEGAASLRFTLDRSGIAKDASVQVEVVSSANTVVLHASTGDLDLASGSVSVQRNNNAQVFSNFATALGIPLHVLAATTTGWHTIRLVGNVLPEAGAPFQLSVTYRGGAA